MNPHIVALGEPMVEFSAVEAGPLRAVESFRRGWGGDTSNFAVAAARLGETVGYVCRLGDDEWGRSFLELWAAEGIDTSRVVLDREGYTGVYWIARRPGGDHEFTYIRRGSAASRLRPEDLDPEYLRSARLLHTSGITQAISPSACDTVFAAIAAARAGGAVVSYDPNLRLKLWSLERARAVILHTVSLVDIVLPNLEEARLLTGLDDPDAVADRFLELGAGLVALKMGPHGCLLARSGERVRVPAYPVPVVDTSGAGDAFDAGLAVGYLAGLDLEGIARLANATGALAATGYGCVTPLPRRAAVEALIGGALTRRGP